MIEVQESPV